MPKLRVHCFSSTLDGYNAGPSGYGLGSGIAARTTDALAVVDLISAAKEKFAEVRR